MPPSGLPAYHAAVEAARSVGLRLTGVQLDAFQRILEIYAEELAARVATGAHRRGHAWALSAAREIIQSLIRDAALSTKSGVTLTADRVARIYADATAALIDANGARLSIGTAFTGVGASAAQAVLSRPELSASFVSIRRESVRFVDQILGRALLRGSTTSELAMELRLHVVGAEAFPPGVLLDRRRIGYAVLREMGYDPTPENLRIVRQLAGRVASRAQLIARTEPMNAEWEAHRQSAHDSPVVADVQWLVSSRHPKPDQCDVLQDTDFFGLGSGVYPTGRLPRRPHPRCICRQVDRIRPVEEWGEPKGPDPRPRVTAAQAGQRAALSPSQSQSLAVAMSPSGPNLPPPGSGGPSPPGGGGSRPSPSRALRSRTGPGGRHP